jgi:C4-dicarboxylate-specific signal transduction histidine kinase
VATSVLHNVGNVLNSVNVSANLVVDYVRNSKANGLSRVAALLEEAGPDLGVFFTQDERGKRLPQYLAKLSTQIGTDQQQILTELVTLQKNIEHIKDIVAMQQSYAKLGGLTETVHVSELVEDALRLNEGALNRHGVTLQREFSPVGTIVIDKHKVLQVLVNLIRNAKYACDASGRPEKLLTVKVVPGGRGVQITVADNGVGIAPEHMVRIFHHGFTTKKEGHGFGLHSGALIAKELGGELRVQSEGTDRGASFTLDLPSQPPQQGRQ